MPVPAGIEEFVIRDRFEDQYADHVEAPIELDFNVLRHKGPNGEHYGYVVWVDKHRLYLFEIVTFLASAEGEPERIEYKVLYRQLNRSDCTAQQLGVFDSIEKAREVCGWKCALVCLVRARIDRFGDSFVLPTLY